MILIKLDFHHNYLPANLLPDVLVATAESLLAARTTEAQLGSHSVQDVMPSYEADNEFGPYSADGSILYEAEHQ